MILLAGGVAVVLGLSVVGFPEFLTRWILAGLNSGDYFVQAHEVYLDLGGGMRARNVSIYRKGLPGPPFLEARECRILYHFLEYPRRGQSRIKELKVSDGILRPLWNTSSFGSQRNILLNGERVPSKTSGGDFKTIKLDVSLNNFDVLGVWVENVRTAVQIDTDGVYLSRLSGKIGRELHSGTIEGTLAYRRKGLLTGRIATSFDPRALMPVCKLYYPEAVGVLDRFSFPTVPPRMDFNFEAVSKPTLSLVAKGRIQASNYAYRGAVIGFANMNVDVVGGNGTNSVTIDPFSLTIGGLQARGLVHFDFMSGVADFQTRSEVSLATILRLVGLKESLMDSWNFEEGARVAAKGHIAYVHPEQSEVEAVVEGGKIGYKGIVLSNYSFNYKNLGLVHTFSDFRGNAGGGFLGGGAVLLADKTGTRWTAEVKAEIINIDSDELLKLISTNAGWRLGGKTFGNLEIGGIGAELAGQGQLTIREARIFKSPVASKLAEHWGAVASDLDLADMPFEARLTFELKNKLFNSKDLYLETDYFGVAAQGCSGWDGSLDWVLKPMAAKKIGMKGRSVVTLLSPLWQGGYHLTGTLERPEWRSISR